MAVSEDVIRLVLETQGKETIDQLQKSTSNYRALLEELTKSYAKGEQTTEEFLKGQRKYSAELDEQTDLLNQLKAAQTAQAAVQDKVADSTTKATKGMAGFGQSALQTGRVVQDFAQGGIGGILNNIEGLTMALGLGTGLAGVLTILGVVLNTFKPQIAEFIKSFDTAVEPVEAFRGTIETLEAKIKELSEKPHKFSVDIQQLETAKQQIDDIKKGLAALEAAKSGRTPDEKAAGEQFAKEFDETGGEGKAALEAVQRQMEEAVVASNPKVRAERKALADRQQSQARTEQALQEAEARATQAMTSGADLGTVAQLSGEADTARKEAEAFADPKAMATLRDNVKQAVESAKELARKELGNADAAVRKGNDPDARDFMAERFRAAGQGKFAGMVAGASPDAIAAAREEEQRIEAEDAEFERRNEAAKRARLKRRDAEKERVREAEAAGRAAEHDPAVKAEFDRINKTFGGFGQEGVDANQAAKNAAAARQRDNAKGQRADDAPTANAMAAAMNDIANVAAGVVNNQALAANKMIQAAARLRQVQQQAERVRRQIEMPGNWNGNPMGGD